MREILFRGKDFSGVLNHSWVFGSLDTTEKEHRSIIYLDRYGNRCRITVDPKTVGQYTGLTDDNEKKIFEGDILNVINPDDDDYITKVYFKCNTLCVDVEGQDYDYTSIGFATEIWDDECDRVEIIGNIHDNPELLEVQE